MPITTFQSSVRPNASSLDAAYRPIVFQPQFNTIVGPFPPVVYCDVYFNGSYYRTLTSTTYLQTTAFNAPYWKFDIQVVAQEYLRSNLPILTSINIQSTLVDTFGVNGSSVGCYCKFRVSSFDSNGFVVQEGSNGSGGYTSPTFYIINSALQHEDNQDLKTHLNSFKMPIGAQVGPYEFVPLTHRTNGDIISKYDYDNFPFLSISGGAGSNGYCLGIMYKKNGDISNTVAYTGYNYLPTANIACTLPSGVLQLKQLTWNSNLLPVVPTTIAFDDVIEYSLFLLYNIGSLVAPSPSNLSFATPIFRTYGCNCNENRLRIRFLNSIGYYDCANFSDINGSLITTSDSWQKALKYPLAKSDGGARRLNVRSNEQFTISTCEYGEDKQEWLKELFDTPEAYIEWPGGQSQGAANIPIVIKDGEFITRKQDDRYEYVTQVVFTMANENIRQRT